MCDLKVTNTDRDISLDTAKGIAIVLMVIGHCYCSDNILLNLIYSFHMPAFFMISGIIYGSKWKSGGGGGNSLIRQAKRLLIPYVIFGMAFSTMLTLLNHPEGIITGIWNNVVLIITLKGVSVLWYLPCAFLVLVIYWCVVKLLKKNIALANLCFSIILFIVAIAIKSDKFIVIQRVMIGYFFFSIGVYYEQKGQETLPLLGDIFLAFVFVALALLNGMVSLVDMRLNQPVLYALNGILGTYVLLRISQWLTGLQGSVWRRTSSFVQYLGRSTLVILCTHMFWVEFLRIVDYKLFHDIMKTWGYFEGILFGLIVILCILPTIPVLDRCLKKIT